MLGPLEKTIEWAADLADDSRIPWKRILIGGITARFLFRTYLDLRQYRVLQKKEFPKKFETRGITDEATYRRSQAYNTDNRIFTIINRLIETVPELLIYSGTNIMPRIYGFSSSLALRLGGGPQTAGILTAVVVYGISILTSIPGSLYRTFVIEEKFGYNKYTLGLWIKDQLKTYALFAGLGVPILYAIQWFLIRFGYRSVAYILAFNLGLELVLQVVFPVLIMPWFYNFSPLEDGELKTEIEALAKKEGFPVKQLYVMDGSTRSSHSNAFFVGMPWYKQIVLFDTLINDMSVPEIVAVLAHELGHWKHNHISILIGANLLKETVEYGFIGLFLTNTSFYTSLGFSPGQLPVIIAFISYMDVLSPLSIALNFAHNYVTRSCEYDADNFAARRGYSAELSKGLVTLGKKSLSEYDNDWLYSLFRHSHPSTPERIDAIEEVEKKNA